jgi:transposase-like protein
LTEWRKQRRQGQLQALTPAKRGRKPDQAAVEMATLRRENERLRSQLSQAELIISAQKKLSQALHALMTDKTEI